MVNAVMNCGFEVKRSEKFKKKEKIIEKRKIREMKGTTLG